MDNHTEKEQLESILGFGFTHTDGHIRITEGEDFKLMLGSEQTHEEMVGILTQIQKRAAEKGKSLRELSRDEFLQIAADIDQLHHRSG